MEHQQIEWLNEVHKFFKSHLVVDEVQRLPTKSEELSKTSKNYDDGEKVRILIRKSIGE